MREIGEGEVKCDKCGRIAPREEMSTNKGYWFCSVCIGKEALEDCGSCGAWHRANFQGDCRDDNERYVDTSPPLTAQEMANRKAGGRPSGVSPKEALKMASDGDVDRAVDLLLESVGTLYLRMEPTTDYVKGYDLGGKLDVQAYKDRDAKQPYARWMWDQKHPGKIDKTAVVNGVRWDVVWLPDKTG